MTSPQFTADETFFDALFGEGPVKFAEIKAKAEKGKRFHRRDSDSVRRPED